MDKSRFPVITVIILLLNVIFYGIAFLMGSPNRVEIERIAGELTNYCMDHPYLDLPQETFQKLPPDSQRGIALIKSKRTKVADMLDAVNKKRMLDEQILNWDSQAEPTEEELASQQALLEKTRKAEQQQLDAMVQEFEQALAVTFYTEYGYVPQKGTVQTMLTSMFLHDKLGLLLLNMLILGIVGWRFEQAWGHIMFPVGYLLGGIVATFFYSIMMSTRTEPLLGPAGAITAVIGMLALHLIFRQDPANMVLLPILGGGLLIVFITQSHAVWFPVGGLVFGLVAGGVAKFSGLEARLLAAEPAQVPVDVDKLVSTGIQKLQDQDLEGAIQDFQRAAKERPTDPAIHSELCRVYLQNGNKKSALRQFKRTVQLYLKQNELEKAVDEYLDITMVDPEMAVDPPQQKKIAVALEERAAADDSLDLFERTALAYKHLIASYKQVIKNLESPEAVSALIQYGDINLSRLKRPQTAYEAYRTALQSSALSPQQQQAVKAKARKAVQLISPQKQPPPEDKPHDRPHQNQTTASLPQHSKPEIPLQKRIKLIQSADAPAKYQVSSVAPLDTNQVVPVSGGMDLQRPSESPLAFQRIYAICVAQLPKTMPGQIVVDLFPGGQPRPYRITSNNVVYTQFFQKHFPSAAENFRQFILHIISQINSVYIDQGTLNFLKTGKPQIFSSQDELAMHEKMFWQQLMGAVRFQCEQCWQVYWVDGHKIPQDGAKTTCSKCGNPLFVQRPTKSA